MKSIKVPLVSARLGKPGKSYAFIWGAGTQGEQCVRLLGEAYSRKGLEANTGRGRAAGRESWAPPPAPRLMKAEPVFHHSKPATGQRAAARRKTWWQSLKDGRQAEQMV